MSGVGQRFRGPSFLQGALDRFSSPELRDFIRRWKINLEEVESLKRTSAKIHYLSDDAEVKQFTNDAVKLWLNHLKQFFYDAEDILDDYATEILRLKLESNSHHQTQQQSDGTESADKDINETSEGIDQPKVFNMAEELQGIKRFGSKVRDIHEKLKSVEQKGAALGLMNSSIGSGSSRPFRERPQTSSLVNSTNVFGRDEDKWKIVDWLLSAPMTMIIVSRCCPSWAWVDLARPPLLNLFTTMRKLTSIFSSKLGSAYRKTLMS
ncbi:putative disease resistance RPP13-like protein 1 [Macadamia integrifolia]|uniref:putative disease resistance RPP13-like protein 1 n=1 Tax=Macadamia integrifolia TaxID=60698 RepID=UPI001C4F14CF|nr:putative disease resistance RPP13-like protein 1 [Macadamia integrifolia]